MVNLIEQNASKLGSKFIEQYNYLISVVPKESPKNLEPNIKYQVILAITNKFFLLSKGFSALDSVSKISALCILRAMSELIIDLLYLVNKENLEYYNRYLAFGFIESTKSVLLHQLATGTLDKDLLNLLYNISCKFNENFLIFLSPKKYQEMLSELKKLINLNETHLLIESEIFYNKFFFNLKTWRTFKQHKFCQEHDSQLEEPFWTKLHRVISFHGNAAIHSSNHFMNDYTVQFGSPNLINLAQDTNTDTEFYFANLIIFELGEILNQHYLIKNEEYKKLEEIYFSPT